MLGFGLAGAGFPACGADFCPVEGPLEDGSGFAAPVDDGALPSVLGAGAA
ncbi:hypothetical protein [Nocardia wallacei]|nr:hypothetical protein [Nocardia wallacei]